MHVISQKKLRKDGSIMESYHQAIVEYLRDGEIIIMPVDGVYGAVGINCDNVVRKMKSIPHVSDDKIYFISDFSMLDALAHVSKKEYDFLHRIWPDHVVVLLNEKSNGAAVTLGMSKYRFVSDIISELKHPLLFMNISKKDGKIPAKKKDILAFSECCDAKALFIIEEWCRGHLPSTVVDLTKPELKMVKKGRVSLEELQSLYFLESEE